MFDNPRCCSPWHNTVTEFSLYWTPERRICTTCTPVVALFKHYVAHHLTQDQQTFSQYDLAWDKHRKMATCGHPESKSLYKTNPPKSTTNKPVWYQGARRLQRKSYLFSCIVLFANQRLKTFRKFWNGRGVRQCSLILWQQDSKS